MVVSLLALVVVAVGVAIAWFFVGQREVPREAPQDVSFDRPGRAPRPLRRRDQRLAWSSDPGRSLAHGLTTIDKVGVDGAVEGGAWTVAGLGRQLRKVQTGFVRSYALSLLGGVLLVVVALLAVNLV